MPGGSVVRVCPESRDSDLLKIERIVNKPQVPYMYVCSSDLRLCMFLGLKYPGMRKLTF